MAFPTGYTRRVEMTTLASGVSGSGTLTDFPVMLTESEVPSGMLDGGADSCANGGGDIRASSDLAGTSQIPIEIVECVTGGTPSLIMFVRTDLNGAADGTFYLWWAGPDGSQPSVTDPGGRNAVWEAYDGVLHLVESGSGVTDEYVDSTGNGNDATGGSAFGDGNPAQQSTGGVFNNGPVSDWDDNQDDVIKGPDGSWFDGQDRIYTSICINMGTPGDDRIFGDADGSGSTDNAWNHRRRGFSGFQQLSVRANVGGTLVDEFGGASLTTAGIWYHTAIRGIIDGSAANPAEQIVGWVDGVEDFAASPVSTPNTFNHPGTSSERFHIGNNNVTNRGFDGLLQEARYAVGAKAAAISTDWVTTESASILDPGTLTNAGTISTVGGGGGDLTADGQLGASAWAGLDASVALGTALTATGQLGSALWAGLDATANVGAALTADGELGASNWVGLDATASIGAGLTAAGQLGVSSWTGSDAAVSLGTPLSATGELGEASWAGLDATAAIAGGLTATGELGASGWAGLNAVATLGTALAASGEIGSSAWAAFDATAFIPSGLTANGELGEASWAGLDGAASLGAELTATAQLGSSAWAGQDATPTLGAPLTAVAELGASEWAGLAAMAATGALIAQGTLGESTWTGLDATAATAGLAATGELGESAWTGLAATASLGTPLTALGALGSSTWAGLDGTGGITINAGLSWLQLPLGTTTVELDVGWTTLELGDDVNSPIVHVRKTDFSTGQLITSRQVLQVVDGVEQPRNITGATVTARFWPPGGGSPIDRVGLVSADDTSRFIYQLTASECMDRGQWRVRLYAALAGEIIESALGVIEVHSEFEH